MRWEKRGLIFNVVNHGLDFDCTEYAQSPQAVVFDDFVRVYFSTRSRTDDGKFVSRIAFADYDLEFSRILNHSRNEVVALGELGCFDEHGIFPFSPLRHGGKILAFTCGWSRRVSVSVETSTGLAVSADHGLTFQKIGSGPVLTSSLNEPMLVGDSFVRFYDGVFHMWYMYGKYWLAGTDEEPAARVYKLAQATSADAVNWTRRKGQIVEDILDEHECQALPTVLKLNEKYHMFFCYRYATDFRNNPKRGYRLGYAVSDDLNTWKRDDENIGIDFSDFGWDSEMMCYPHLVQIKGHVYLLYNGNNFGKYGFGLAELTDL